jgi:oxygen-independent coproporphyrinogen-3 oxidase
VEVERLTDKILAADHLIFGLRMNDGVDLNELEERFPSVNGRALYPLWDLLFKEGYATRPPLLALTDNGRLVADAIGAEIYRHPVLICPLVLERDTSI